MVKAEQSRAPEIHPDFEIPVQLSATDGSRETISARIRRVNHGFFQLRTTKSVDIGRRFLMECENCRLDLEVIYCQRPALGAYFVGARMLSGGETPVRREIRLPVDIPAKATFPGVPEGLPAVVIGISASGLDVLLPKAVENSSMLAIDIGNGIVFGEVRTCTKLSSGQFQAELTLEEFLPRDTIANSHRSAPGLVGRLKNRFLSRS